MRQFLILLWLTGLLASVAFGQTRNITVEPNHSTIGFSIPISGGITRVIGKFTDFDLIMQYDSLDFTKSTAKFIIKTASIDTGIEERDDHLRTADFFDVEQFPEIVFESSGIEHEQGNEYHVHGMLTMHGIKKEITLPLKLLDNDGKNIAGEIRDTINRLDYGVGENFKHTAMKNFIGEEIDLVVNFWTKSDDRFK